MADRIQLRGGTAAEWSAVGATVILADREIGIETDTGKLKFGNGISNWNTLFYLATTIVSSSIDGSNHLKLTLSNGSVLDAGALPTGIVEAPINTTPYIRLDGGWETLVSVMPNIYSATLATAISDLAEGSALMIDGGGA